MRNYSSGIKATEISLVNIPPTLSEVLRGLTQLCADMEVEDVASLCPSDERVLEDFILWCAQLVDYKNPEHARNLETVDGAFSYVNMNSRQNRLFMGTEGYGDVLIYEDSVLSSRVLPKVTTSEAAIWLKRHTADLLSRHLKAE